MITLKEINKQLQAHQISQVQLVRDLGVDKGTISLWLSGDRNMSKPTQAMFYYYLKFLKAK